MYTIKLKSKGNIKILLIFEKKQIKFLIYLPENIGISRFNKHFIKKKGASEKT